jgi:hypothetical protein
LGFLKPDVTISIEAEGCFDHSGDYGPQVFVSDENRLKSERRAVPDLGMTQSVSSSRRPAARRPLNFVNRNAGPASGNRIPI